MRACIVLLILATSAFAGCAPPRGPINIDPYLPRWLSHGEVSCECPPPPAIDAELIDRDAVQPPLPKFHPVPTRPAFLAEHSSNLQY
jgi:hypothetical protein